MLFIAVFVSSVSSGCGSPLVLYANYHKILSLRSDRLVIHLITCPLVLSPSNCHHPTYWKQNYGALQGLRSGWKRNLIVICRRACSAILLFIPNTNPELLILVFTNSKSGTMVAFLS